MGECTPPPWGGRVSCRAAAASRRVPWLAALQAAAHGDPENFENPAPEFRARTDYDVETAESVLHGPWPGGVLPPRQVAGGCFSDTRSLPFWWLMSVPVPFAAVSTPRAGGASPEVVVDQADREIVATIPIKVPLPTFPPPVPEPEATPAFEAPALSDAELLAAFVQRRDAAAFTQIVERYGPMVYRVALRAVEDRHLADDVYQATFLVLAQSASKIRNGEVLPAWLHGTARNLARRALTNQYTQRQRLAELAAQSLAEKGGEMTPSTELDPFEELVRLNNQQLLDEELQQLPEASRAPLVLFYLEGKTQAEIAQQMGLSVEAVEGRLRRAKQELRQRLIRRGVFLSTIVAAATVLTPSLATAAPASTLVSATLATALGTTAVGTSLLGGTVASTTLGTGATTAAQLAAQEVAAMSAASKATAILITTVASATVATGLMFGAIVGSMSGKGTSETSVAQAANVSPPALERFEIPEDGFSGLGEEPVLLALSDPKETIETERDNSPHNEPENPADAEIKPVVYQIADLNEEQQHAAVKYAQSWAESVTDRPETHCFIVRGNTKAHQQIAAYLASQRRMRKQIGEFVLTLEAEIQRKLKTHSDNHPDILKLQSQRKRLEGAMEQEDLRVHEQADLATLADKRSESRSSDADPRIIESAETTVRLPPHHAGKLKFPSRVTVIDGFQSALLSVDPLSPTLIRVEAKAVGETVMTVTCESGKKYQVTVQVHAPTDVKSRDELVRQKDAEIAKWQQAYRVEQVDKERQRDEVGRATKEYSERVSRLNQIVDFQRQKLDELTPGCVWDLADGKITIVDNNTGTVWLNLGRKNGLRTQTTFSVYDNTHQGIARGPKDVKARIEVVELRETSSIARVVEEERDRPIVVGDEIFSPAWCEGLTEHFAIVGSFDLNNDGKMDAKDRQILKDLLDHAGSEIDLEITAEGLREPADAKLTADTKWLLVGDIGDPATAVNDPEKLKQLLAVQKQHDLLVQEARELGIKIVSLKDFLTYLGWKPESRVYVPAGGVPLNLKPGARNVGVNPLAQVPQRLSEQPMPKPAPVTEEMSQFLLQWESKNKNITSLQSKFTRIEFDHTFDTETRWTGTFYLERPDRWRIDFEPADAALLDKPSSRSRADGTPFRVKSGAATQWICTGKRLYVLDVTNRAYDTFDFTPQYQGQNRTGPGLPHSIGGPLPFLFALKAEDAKQLFTLRFGALFHNPLGGKLGADGKPLHKAIHIVANPIHPGIAKWYSEVEVVFDADTYLPLNLRIIDPAGDKETVYSFDQSNTKLGEDWGRNSPFRDPFLVSLKQGSVIDSPMEFPNMETIFRGMLLGNSIAPPEKALDPASLARTSPITEPMTEIKLAAHEVRLLQFPVPIMKAEIQGEPVLEVTSLRDLSDMLHLRAITDGSCQLIVTGTDAAVYRVSIKAGTLPMNRFRELNPEEEKVAKALQQRTSLEFNDNTLKEVRDFVGQLHNVPIKLDETVEEFSEIPVTFVRSDITLEQALTEMLATIKNPQLSFYIDGGKLHISPVSAMKEQERLVYYRLAGLSPEGQAAAEKYITPLAISVAPLEGDLLIDASDYTHKKFEEYLHGVLRLESQRPARAIELQSRADR